MVQALKKQTLEWREGTPVAPLFDDVYYSLENGLEESRFVFIKGTGIETMWREKSHTVIAETGFGTGLNFLATWQAWRQSPQKGRLTFISVEGYPLDAEALEAAHQNFPELADLALELRRAWPPASPGFHPRYFEGGKINLLLLFGEAAQAFSELQAKVDAWYLDGFAPAKNPGMWSDTVMDQIARLSKPGTRFATFTAAGFVRRALQARGFDVQKVPGYGRKRERLVGEMQTAATSEYHATKPPEWAALPPSPQDISKSVAVIGTGIAGASVAAALKRRGLNVRCFSSSKKPTASHVPSAILAPRFILGNQPHTYFFTSAFAYTTQQTIWQNAISKEIGLHILAPTQEDKERQDKIAATLDWGEDWLIQTTEGMYFPKGLSLDTKTALTSLLQDIPLEQADIHTMTPTTDGWKLTDTSGTIVHEAEIVVLACGISDTTFAPIKGNIELRPNRGQVELCENMPADIPKDSLSYGGYVTAPHQSGLRTIGSTFDKVQHVSPDDYHPKETSKAEILAKLKAATGISISPDTIISSWAGVRATTPDHLPYAGPVPKFEEAGKQYMPLAQDAKKTGLGSPNYHNGLYMLTGLGSKGYQYAPLAAEYIAAHICGDPIPISMAMTSELHPLRRVIRKIIRRTG